MFKKGPTFLKVYVIPITAAAILALHNGLSHLAKDTHKLWDGFRRSSPQTTLSTSCMSFCCLKRFNPKKIEIGNFQSVSNIKSRRMPYAYVHRKEMLEPVMKRGGFTTHDPDGSHSSECFFQN
jgi:hypothetical protein